MRRDLRLLPQIGSVPRAHFLFNIAYVDAENGVVGLYYIDAFDGTQVIDLKPYTPSIDRIENPKTPQWCSHWPKSYEESGNFDWEAEFNF